MAKYWCVNFDSETSLAHGIEKNLWMMQYQYADDHGNEHQGYKKGRISSNWRRLAKVKPGHWFVAYLPGNRAVSGNPFYAIGQVITPRRPKTAHDHADTIEDYLTRQRSHDHDSGYVYYTPVFYEDFSDKWIAPDDKISRYAQRIDVEAWRHFVPDGVSVTGLNRVPRHKTVNAVFEIDKEFFERIRAALVGELAKTMIPEEVDGSGQLLEGAVKTISVNAYERNREARSKCIEHHGWACAVCEYDMAGLYGEFGEGVIHVHHLRELASLGKEYEVDPVKDLRPVCPNCHAILHTSSPAMTIKQLRKVLAGRKPIRWPGKP
jgi:hypothetical protein